MLQSHFVTLEEVQARLPELLDSMLAGETLHITINEHTIAKMVKQPPPSKEPRKPGSAIGKLVIVSDDDEHLEHFKEYMP